MNIIFDTLFQIYKIDYEIVTLFQLRELMSSKIIQIQKFTLIKIRMKVPRV